MTKCKCTSLPETTSSLGTEELVTLFSTIVTGILDTVAPLKLKRFENFVHHFGWRWLFLNMLYK